MTLPPPLPHTEITRLIRRYRRGDGKAGNTVIEHNLRFARQMAGSYARTTVNLTADDLFQEAVLGMQHALKRFRPKGGCFLTYAKHWMRQYITKAIRNQEHLIRVPINAQMDVIHGRNKQFTQYAKNSRALVYIDAEQEIEGQTHETIPDQSFDEGDSASHINYLIKTGIRELNARERDIIMRRFGLLGEPRTLEQIGDRHGLCRERIRQLETIALKKMRKVLEKAA